MLRTLVLIFMVAAADPDDGNNPSPETVKELTPYVGPQRPYDVFWQRKWVTECQRGHITYSARYCFCMMDSARYFWDFKQIKRITRNVEQGRYVPELWFGLEEMCWNKYEKPYLKPKN